MARSERAAKRGSHLRLVKPPVPSDLPPIITDPKARKDFEQLTQALVDLAIEITEIVDGDPDLEANGDAEPNGDEEAEEGI